jgi:hypothetical protein
VSATDLASVDELCRLAMSARRLGCHIHLVDGDSELQSLLVLAGVDDVVRRCPASPAAGTAAPRGDLR